VLRQFNRTLSRKIEQNLPNCSVLSLAWHSATTYAAAAVDPSAFRGLQFPEPDGPLTAFAARVAERCGVAGNTVLAAEQALGARIIAVDGKTEFARDAVLAAQADLVIYGDVAELEGASPCLPLGRARPAIRRNLRALLHRRRNQPPRLDPILARLALGALIVFLAGSWYFHSVFRDRWLDAAYFVVATMTTTGYGDVTPNRNDPIEVVAAMLLMLSGITFTGLFIAFGASLLTRVQWVTMQGLRPIHRRGHIVVCGVGNIGSEVIDLLLGLGKRLVVVESAPGYLSGGKCTRAAIRSADGRRKPRCDGRSMQSRHRAWPRCLDQCRYPEPRNRAWGASAQPDHAHRAADRRCELCCVDRPPLRV